MKQIIGESKSWSSALPDLSDARQLHSSDFVAKFLPSSCERYPKIGYRREQEKMKSWSSTLPVLFVNCQRHSFDSVAKFLLLDC